ncbi:GL26059 [Drosophila persimilis]|uniref:GL26059 n=1 Tax=Drosophila persimilis TaxID=7234 RepID=B4GKD6_DROPE|nr:GL26059 [Drosophila persimilis]
MPPAMLSLSAISPFPINLVAYSWHHIEPAAYVEIPSGNQIQLTSGSAGLRVKEIIRQAAKEHEMKKKQNFGESPSHREAKHL